MNEQTKDQTISDLMSYVCLLQRAIIAAADKRAGFITKEQEDVIAQAKARLGHDATFWANAGGVDGSAQTRAMNAAEAARALDRL